MSTQNSDFGTVFWVRWVIATVIGWVVGMFGAIILSNLVVNLVYPKETNLIVGLCLGAGVALAQKIGMRQRIRLTKSWVWGAAIGIGIPYVVIVLLNEFLPDAADSWGVPLFVVGSAICGLLQVPALRAHTSRAYWWVLGSTVAWSLAFLVSHVAGTVGLLGAGALLGVISCGTFLWLQKTPGLEETVAGQV